LKINTARLTIIQEATESSKPGKTKQIKYPNKFFLIKINKFSNIKKKTEAGKIVDKPKVHKAVSQLETHLSSSNSVTCDQYPCSTLHQTTNKPSLCS
jgi:hypothetical protein